MGHRADKNPVAPPPGFRACVCMWVLSLVDLTIMHYHMTVLCSHEYDSFMGFQVGARPWRRKVDGDDDELQVSQYSQHARGANAGVVVPPATTR